MFSSVVLPEPDGPMMAIHSPASAVKLTSSSAFNGSLAPTRYSFDTRSTSRNDISRLLSSQYHGRLDAPDARRGKKRRHRGHHQCHRHHGHEYSEVHADPRV